LIASSPLRSSPIVIFPTNSKTSPGLSPSFCFQKSEKECNPSQPACLLQHTLHQTNPFLGEEEEEEEEEGL
jgi:hypothetical protein